MDRLLPRQRSLKGNHPARLLLLCYFDPSGISTVPENIAYLQHFSSFSIDVQNFHGQEIPFRWKSGFRLQEYDAVIFHNTVTYNIDGISDIDACIDLKLENYDGLKVVFKQDEQYRPNRVAEFLGRIKVDLVFSCLPESEYLKVYPREVTGVVRFARMLTGYVTPPMRQYTFSQTDTRPIDVGYRGSIQPIYFGRLAFEKRKIGDDFLHKADGRGLKLDISSDWSARFCGDRWIKFLARCKATLGSESGASIFDLSGEVENAYRGIIEKYGEHLEEQAWCEMVLDLLAEYEGKIHYNQISPRHFEAAATRTLQFLYDGEYSGIFKPYEHYIPVRKDMGNFEELVSTLYDQEVRTEITNRAFEEVILDRKNWIENFAESFDRHTMHALAAKGSRTAKWKSVRQAKVNALLICGHEPHLDPRIGWIADNAPDDVLVHIMGVHDNPGYKEIQTSKTKNGGFEIEIYRRGNKSSWLGALSPSPDTLNPGLLAINLMSHLLNMPEREFRQSLRVETNSARVENFRWYLGYFTSTSTALSIQGSRLTNIGVVIATDLDTLPAGIVLKDYFDAALIYDSHEFWAESDLSNEIWERNFWRSIEKFLLPSTHFSITVSPNLADYMSSSYGRPFVAVPNCIPLTSFEMASEPVRLIPEPGVSFLYQGNYAKGRGLELLIQAWPKTNGRAFLFLRGPHCAYERSLINLAKGTGQLNRRIFFLDPVSEEELVVSAKSGDVGVIPYEPIGVNHKYCCPNKLSQYCLAGIPILANETDFIGNVVDSKRLGVVTDFSNEAELVKSINFLAENSRMRDLAAERCLEFVHQEYHWEVASRPLYEAIQKHAKTAVGESQTFLRSSVFSGLNEDDPKISMREKLRIFAVEPKGMGLNLYVLARCFWHLIPPSLRSKLFLWITRDNSL